MDFSLASKHKREVDQRRKDAKRKLDEKRRDEERQACMEEEQRLREEERTREAEAERLRLEEEALLNDGVRYRARLQPIPVARADDKLTLPPSALEELDRQNAIEKGELLTFRVSFSAGPGGKGPEVGRTHAGVAEFTAEEGTVGVPPRVALCLTKGVGLDTLGAVGLVEVRFVRLPRSAKSRVKLQPRGEGFHAGGAAAVRMDLEHVLQETLRGHTALTQGDWLPIRHDGSTFELVVRELEPEPHLALLNTDLTVEVLPSEQTEAELRAEEERKARAEAAARAAEERERARVERAKRKAEALAPEPPQGAEGIIQLLLRLPDGGRLSRRFHRDCLLREVLDWVESEPNTLVQPDAFRIVQKWPGHCRELGPSEADESLAALKFSRQEALFLQRLGEEAEDGEADVVDGNAPIESTVARPAVPAPLHSIALGGASGGEWSAAEASAHRQLDRRLEGEDTPTAAARMEPELDSLKGTELVEVFERLRAFGMNPPEAATAAKRFSAQLKELAEMGFDNWPEAVRLLHKYDGRLLRVANLLSEQAFQATEGVGETVAASMQAHTAVPEAPPPAAQANTAPPVEAKDTGAGLPKDAVAATFKELIACGKPPNEAAMLAIKHVRQAMAAETARTAEVSVAPRVAEEPERAAGGEVNVDEKLQELASMGFIDEDRNRALIRKYAGRMERVIEALCS